MARFGLQTLLIKKFKKPDSFTRLVLTKKSMYFLSPKFKLVQGGYYNIWHTRYGYYYLERHEYIDEVQYKDMLYDETITIKDSNGLKIHMEFNIPGFPILHAWIKQEAGLHHSDVRYYPDILQKVMGGLWKSLPKGPLLCNVGQFIEQLRMFMMDSFVRGMLHFLARKMVIPVLLGPNPEPGLTVFRVLSNYNIYADSNNLPLFADNIDAYDDTSSDVRDYIRTIHGDRANVTQPEEDYSDDEEDCDEEPHIHCPRCNLAIPTGPSE